MSEYRSVRVFAVAWEWRCPDCGKNQIDYAPHGKRVMCDCQSVFELIPPTPEILEPCAGCLDNNSPWCGECRARLFTWKRSTKQCCVCGKLATSFSIGGDEKWYCGDHFKRDKEKTVDADAIIADIREVVRSWFACNDNLSHRECDILNSISKCYRK
jgi:ribosomal protein S27E